MKRRRIAVIISAVAMSFSLAACSGSGNSGSSPSRPTDMYEGESEIAAVSPVENENDIPAIGESTVIYEGTDATITMSPTEKEEDLHIPVIGEGGEKQLSFLSFERVGEKDEFESNKIIITSAIKTFWNIDISEKEAESLANQAVDHGESDPIVKAALRDTPAYCIKGEASLVADLESKSVIYFFYDTGTPRETDDEESAQAEGETIILDFSIRLLKTGSIKVNYGYF